MAMAMARSFFFSLTLCFALLLPISCATRSSRRSQYQGVCQIHNLKSLKPSDRVESEAGFSEFWDVNEHQFECAGVAPVRHTIQPKGLLLPSYSNSPRLLYIIHGEGVGGAVIPGCPETFQSFQLQDSQSQRSRSSRRQSERRGRGDEHQRLHSIRQGDIFALPEGVSIWAYNDGDRPLTAVSILDIGNDANQLDRTPRRFFLAGRKSEESDSDDNPNHHRWGMGRRSSQSETSFKNIFNGFDTDILSEAFGIDTETARKMQNVHDSRGFIVRVDNLRLARPRMEEEQEERRGSRGSQRGNDENGMEESFCNMKLSQNIDNPSVVDVYSRDGGHLTTLNGAKLPILHYLKLTAEKGYLRRNSMLAPHWNMNAHSIVYAIRGNARMQIVDDTGRSVFDDSIKEGEMVVVPQNYAVMKQAHEDSEFEWISFKTSNYALTSSLSGKTSVLRGLPEEVLVNSYGISREEARRLKYGREKETSILRPIRLARS